MQHSLYRSIRLSKGYDLQLFPKCIKWPPDDFSEAFWREKVFTGEGSTFNDARHVGVLIKDGSITAFNNQPIGKQHEMTLCQMFKNQNIKDGNRGIFGLVVLADCMIGHPAVTMTTPRMIQKGSKTSVRS